MRAAELGLKAVHRRCKRVVLSVFSACFRRFPCRSSREPYLKGVPRSSASRCGHGRQAWSVPNHARAQVVVTADMDTCQHAPKRKNGGVRWSSAPSSNLKVVPGAPALVFANRLPL